MLKQPKKRGSFCRRFIGDNGGFEHLRRITLTGRGKITKSRITRTVLPRCLVVRGGENGGQRAEQMILGLLLRSACTIILDFYFTMYRNVLVPYQNLAGSESESVSNYTDPDPTKTIENRK